MNNISNLVCYNSFVNQKNFCYTFQAIFMKDILVFDLETKKSFEEVGGQHKPELLGVSVCGVYSYNRNQYRGFREEEFTEMKAWLEDCGLLIGFNSKTFDVPALQPYYKDFDLSAIPHLDILEEVYKALNHRLKLDSLANSTLGEGKSGSGLDAIWYFKNNQWEPLIKYCLDDVRVTKDVYEYGKNHGVLWYEGGGRKDPIKISWGEGEPVVDQIQKFFASGQQVEIDYLKTDLGVRKNWVIDIRSIKNGLAQAFVPADQTIKTFSLDKIMSVKVVGQQANWQNKLF